MCRGFSQDFLAGYRAAKLQAHTVLAVIASRVHFCPDRPILNAGVGQERVVVIVQYISVVNAQQAAVRIGVGYHPNHAVPV